MHIGYLDEVVDPDHVVDTAIRRAAGMARMDRRAYLRTRELVWAPVQAEVESALAERRAAVVARARS